MAGRARGCVVGMDLNGQLLGGEQIFDEQGQAAALGMLEPDFADRFGIVSDRAERRGQIAPPPDLLNPSLDQPR